MEVRLVVFFGKFGSRVRWYGQYGGVVVAARGGRPRLDPLAIRISRAVFAPTKGVFFRLTLSLFQVRLCRIRGQP